MPIASLNLASRRKSWRAALRKSHRTADVPFAPRNLHVKLGIRFVERNGRQSVQRHVAAAE